MVKPKLKRAQRGSVSVFQPVIRNGEVIGEIERRLPVYTDDNMRASPFFARVGPRGAMQTIRFDKETGRYEADPYIEGVHE